MPAKTVAKKVEKGVPEKFFDVASRYPVKDGRTDLIDYLDEIDQLTELNNTEEGGFRVPTSLEQKGKTHVDWEANVVRILTAIGFKCEEWKGEMKSFERNIIAKANGKSINFCY